MNTKFIEQLLILTAKYDAMSELWWNEDLNFSAICNDVFWWGTADCEDITPDTIVMLEKALADGGILYGMMLYCARQRKMRPQGAIYKDIDKKYWPLFDACGPERKNV